MRLYLFFMGLFILDRDETIAFISIIRKVERDWVILLINTSSG